jgi:outer membrane protein TolC
MTALLALLVMTAAPAAVPLTEERAVALALQNSPELAWRRHAVDEKEALTQAGLAWQNPVLRVSGLRYDRLVQPAVERQDYGEHPFAHTTVALRWSPPGLGERGFRRAEGRAAEIGSRVELAIARRDISALVRGLHARLVSYDAQVAMLEEQVGQREKLRGLVQRRLELQAATLLDQSLTEVDYLDARTQLAALEVRRRRAYDELLIQLGLAPDTEIVLAPSASACSVPEDGTQLALRAARNNPRRSSIQAQLDAADAERDRYQLERLPWLDYVQIGYGVASANQSGYVAFQLQLTLPLLDWKGPHRRAVRARKLALGERILTEDRRLSEMVVRTRAALAEQAALVERYRDAASELEQGAATLRKALAQGGPTNLSEVSLLQARLLATRRAHLAAELECRLQQIEMDRLTGSGVERQD